MRYENVDTPDREARKIADRLIGDVGNETILEKVAEHILAQLRRLAILRFSSDDNNEQDQ